jgi:serine/threonine protein kinase
LHRDLKPANVLVADDGRPVLLDFSLAAAGGSPQPGGTLPYMAPEALAAFLGRPQSVDARSDLYSLGVILFQLLTARLPFAPPRDTTPVGLAAALQERYGPPPEVRPHNPAVTPAAEAVVRRLLEPDPARRYPGARQLQKELARCLRRPPQLPLARRVRGRFAVWLRRPLGPVWQVGMLTTLLVLLRWLFWR